MAGRVVLAKKRIVLKVRLTMETKISKNGKRILKGAMFGACFAMTVALFETSVTYGHELKINALVSTQTKDKDEVYYIGKVTGGVNVRVGAGSDKNQLVVGNQSVKLKKGTEVTILSEVMVGKKPWYEIRFEFEKNEVVGYATSTYIEKTSKTVTPTPIPTLSPTPTITPTTEPTAIPTVEPTTSPTQNQKETDNSKGSMILWIFGGIAMVALGIVLALSVKKKRKEEYAEANEVSKKVEKLKNMVITKDIDEKESPDEKLKRKAQGKFTKEGKPTRQPVAVQHTSEVYVKNSKLNESSIVTDEFAATSEQVIEDISKNKDRLEKNSLEKENLGKENLGKESVEKTDLRKAIQALREHDIVIHKYFGKGEVFDNSDVKLIEVRFGGDVRFLNKEQLVNKKLLQITNERRR
nr:SH3 domain-containing protein [uncultured Lachnoclostridium sp.]